MVSFCWLRPARGDPKGAKVDAATPDDDWPTISRRLRVFRPGKVLVWGLVYYRGMRIGLRRAACHVVSVGRGRVREVWVGWRWRRRGVQ